MKKKVEVFTASDYPFGIEDGSRQSKPTKDFLRSGEEQSSNALPTKLPPESFFLSRCLTVLPSLRNERSIAQYVEGNCESIVVDSEHSTQRRNVLSSFPLHRTRLKRIINSCEVGYLSIITTPTIRLGCI